MSHTTVIIHRKATFYNNDMFLNVFLTTIRCEIVFVQSFYNLHMSKFVQVSKFIPLYSYLVTIYSLQSPLTYTRWIGNLRNDHNHNMQL